ncbi:unnamed protein product [Ranitomeya imitator]|uniref:Uncharacterized protein n=1 Tax=Ranitomeya imitator TaxID=111125 RepID=A0ABN9LI96_9NEOB|nr:unnamed protein product [Ranitomeya imitator]
MRNQKQSEEQVLREQSPQQKHRQQQRQHLQRRQQQGEASSQHRSGGSHLGSQRSRGCGRTGGPKVDPAVEIIPRPEPSEVLLMLCKPADAGERYRLFICRFTVPVGQSPLSVVLSWDQRNTVIALSLYMLILFEIETGIASSCILSMGSIFMIVTVAHTLHKASQVTCQNHDQAASTLYENDSAHEADLNDSTPSSDLHDKEMTPVRPHPEIHREFSYPPFVQQQQQQQTTTTAATQTTNAFSTI